MNLEGINKSLHEYDNAISSNGICLLNVAQGGMVASVGMHSEMEKSVHVMLEDNEFEGMNSLFNSIFYNRGFPELVTIKRTNHSRFIKFLDKDHLVLSHVDKEKVNYGKIKLYFDKITNKE